MLSSFESILVFNFALLGKLTWNLISKDSFVFNFLKERCIKMLDSSILTQSSSLWANFVFHYHSLLSDSHF